MPDSDNWRDQRDAEQIVENDEHLYDIAREGYADDLEFCFRDYPLLNPPNPNNVDYDALIERFTPAP